MERRGAARAAWVCLREETTHREAFLMDSPARTIRPKTPDDCPAFIEGAAAQEADPDPADAHASRTEPAARARPGRHLWILNHYAVEPGRPGGTRHFSLARYLAGMGWTTTIFAASTVLNSGDQRLRPGETSRFEVHAGVPFRWIRTPGYEGNGLGRIVNMLTFAVRMLSPAALRGATRPDAIIGSSVHPLAAAAAALLSIFYKVPFVFEIRDLWPQTLIDMNAMAEHSLQARGLRWLEGWLCRRAAKIIVLLPFAERYLVARGVNPDKITWIPNGVDLADHPEPTPPEPCPSFTLMYFGAHGQANGLDQVLQAMALLESDPRARHLRLRLIGDGPCKPDLEKLARQLDLKSVAFEAPRPKNEIPALAREADAFVFCLLDVPVFRYGVSSNKLFDFLAAGRPVIYFCNAGAELVESSGAGVSASAGDPRSLADAILRIAQLPPAERARMGAMGRQLIRERYSFRNLAEALGRQLDEIVDSSKHESGKGRFDKHRSSPWTRA